MEILLWVGIFVVSLIALVKGADWLLGSSERIGLALGLSPFIIGVVIVGLGTSFPELISSLLAVMRGVTEIVTANAVGSNIANILLIIGISALIGKKLIVTKSLIDLDLPLLAISTVILLSTVIDRQITLGESIILLITYVIYLLYTMLHKDDDSVEVSDILPSRPDRRRKDVAKKKEVKKSNKRPKLELRDFGLLILGLAGLVLGANYLIESVINISAILNIGAGVIAISAVALGTSLPELIVSIKAVLNKKSEMAIGNIFGSNIFNGLVVVGIPGLFTNLNIDEQTFLIGIPVMALATLLFVISGISRRIHMWEGAFYLILYIIFIGKLFNIF